MFFGFPFFVCRVFWVGFDHCLCIYTITSISLLTIFIKKCLIKMSWLLCNALCFLCLVRHLSSLRFSYLLNSELVFYLTLKYNRPRSLRTSPSWRTAWVEAAWRTCSCSFFLLKMALQPLTLHCTALSWHWLRCSITWHLRKRRSSKL